MAIILKERTSLQERENKVYRKIRRINKERVNLEEKQRSGRGGIRVLMIRWKRFAVLSVLTLLALFKSLDLFLLGLFTIGATAILTMGYAKRDYEDKDYELLQKIRGVQNAFIPWEQGLKGETTIANILAMLPDNYFIINDITIDYKIKAQIDHVVVGPTGIFAIETKSMGGRLRALENNWQHGTRLIKSPQRQSKRSALALSSLIVEKVQAVVALSNPRANWQGDQKEDCPVLRGVHLNEYITSQPRRISSPKDVAYRIIQK